MSDFPFQDTLDSLLAMGFGSEDDGENNLKFLLMQHNGSGDAVVQSLVDV